MSLAGRLRGMIGSRAGKPKSKKARQAKVKRVMGEFKRKQLRSSSGAKVKNRKQAIAISLSEAGLARRQK